jgi:hypothetical protein
MTGLEHQDQVVPTSVLLGFAGSFGAGLLVWTLIIKTIIWALGSVHTA